MNYIKGFTLVEFLVVVIITAIMSFFVYGMVAHSYSGFSKLSSHSKNFDDMKMFISSLRNSAAYADSISIGYDAAGGSSYLSFIRYDKIYSGSYVKIVEYYRCGGNGRFEKNGAYAGATDIRDIPSSKYPSTRCELYKDTYIYDSVSSTKIKFFRTKMSTCVRKVFYNTYNSGYTADGFTDTLDICIVYDDVLDGTVRTDNVSYTTKVQWLCCSLRNLQ